MWATINNWYYSKILTPFYDVIVKPIYNKWVNVFYPVDEILAFFKGQKAFYCGYQRIYIKDRGTYSVPALYREMKNEN